MRHEHILDESQIQMEGFLDYICKKCGCAWLVQIEEAKGFSLKIEDNREQKRFINYRYNEQYTWCSISNKEWRLKELLR